MPYILISICSGILWLQSVQEHYAECLQINNYSSSTKCSIIWFTIQSRDLLVHVSSQWEMTFNCNVITHWLGKSTKWPLLSFPNIKLANLVLVSLATTALKIPYIPIHPDLTNLKRPGPHLNIKTVFPLYGYSHARDKMVVRQSYL